MKKKILFFISLALVVCLLLSPIILHSLVGWYIKGYCRDCLGSHLQFESLYRKDGQWILESPQLHTTKSLQEGGHHLQAHQAIISPVISWTKREIALETVLVHPHIDIGHSAAALKELFLQPRSDSTFFKIKGQFSIPEGSIKLHQFVEDEIHTHPCSFQLECVCHEQSTGWLSLKFANKSDEGNHLKIGFFGSGPDMQKICVSCEKVSCSDVSKAVNYIWPEFNQWMVSDGIIEGKLAFDLTKKGITFTESEAMCHGLSFNHSLLKVQGEIPQLRLQLVEDSVGHLNMPVKGSLVFFKEGNPAWTIDDVSFDMYFRPQDDAKILFNGICRHDDKERAVQIEGGLKLADEYQSSMSLGLKLKELKGFRNEDISAHFFARELGKQYNFIEIGLINFEVEEFDFFQNLFGHYIPQWKDLHVRQGTLDATLLMYLDEFEISDFRMEKGSVHDLIADYSPWGISVQIEEGKGALSLDLSKGLHIDNGILNVSHGALTFGQDHEKWKFSDIHTELAVCKGVLQKSLIQGAFAGLKGTIEVDWNAPVRNVNVDFSGNVRDFANLLPASLKKGIDKKFNQDRIKILAFADRQDTGMAVEGRMFINGINARGEEIAFGFKLEKSSTQEWPTHLFSQVGDEDQPEAVKKLLSSIAGSTSFLNESLMKQDLGFLDVELRKGWFNARNLPLEKYIAPFVFQSHDMQLGGVGDFEGLFDHQSLIVHYDVGQVLLENDKFVIEAKSFGDTEPQGRPRKGLPAAHYFDFKHDQFFGTLPIKNGSYFEKNSGLLFTEVNGLVNLEKFHVNVPKIETFCNGIYLAGSIDANWNVQAESEFDVDINIHTMHGKISQVQNLLAHFNQQIAFVNFPLEGNVSLHQRGVHLHFTFLPDDFEMQAYAQGTLTDGILENPNADVSLQELAMNFVYDHEAHTFECNEIQGALLVGKPNHVEEYSFAGDYIRFNDYTKNEGSFDLWVGDRKRDIIRLVGKTSSAAPDSPYVDFSLDHALSHFGNVHPALFKLTLKEWSQVHAFGLDLDFQLSTLLHDLQRFSRTGLLFLSRHFLQELNSLETASGDFKLSLSYNDDRSLLTYNASGHDIVVGNNKFNTFLLNGKKKGGAWAIEQLQLDQISLAADFARSNDEWTVNFLGARIGSALLLGLQGKYFNDQSALEGEVNLVEVDFARLEEWPSLKATVQEMRLSGVLRGTGKMRIELLKESPRFRIETSLTASLRSCQFRGLRLQDAENCPCHFVSDRGISFKKVKTALQSLKDGAVKSSIYVDACRFDFAGKEFVVDGLHFHTPSENLGWLTDNLQQSFPDAFSQPAVDLLRTAKTTGAFEGTLKIEISDTHYACRLVLKDGCYHFLNKDHKLNHVVLNYDPFEFKAVAQYRYQHHPCWVTIKAASPKYDHGEIILSDIHSEADHPLTVHWQLDPAYGFTVVKAQGMFAGVGLDCERDPQIPRSKNAIALKGTMRMDFSKAHVLLSHSIAEKAMNWGIGAGYSLKGQWEIGKDETKDWIDQLYFQGMLEGRDFEALGYQFQEMNGRTTITPENICVASIAVRDACGQLAADELLLHKDQSDWTFSLPAMKMQDFRPGLLHATKTTPITSGKALVVTELNLQDVAGVVGIKETFSGTGHLHFSNSSKKNQPNVLFAIPAEILSRIGLDLSVLNPVTGTIFYEIKDAKVLLTRFKDIYSEGRLSKFYLPNTAYESYMDFDGGLHVQVRMKQYNLLFKLAELFTVTVQGTLKKPSYTLQKQNHHVSNPKEIVLDKT